MPARVSRLRVATSATASLGDGTFSRPSDSASQRQTIVSSAGIGAAGAANADHRAAWNRRARAMAARAAATGKAGNPARRATRRAGQPALRERHLGAPEPARLADHQHVRQRGRAIVAALTSAWPRRRIDNVRRSRAGGRIRRRARSRRRTDRVHLDGHVAIPPGHPSGPSGASMARRARPSPSTATPCRHSSGTLARRRRASIANPSATSDRRRGGGHRQAVPRAPSGAAIGDRGNAAAGSSSSAAVCSFSGPLPANRTRRPAPHYSCAAASGTHPWSSRRAASSLERYRDARTRRSQ